MINFLSDNYLILIILLLVGFFGMVIFIKTQAVLVDENCHAMDIEVNNPRILRSMPQNALENELDNRINGYRKRNGLKELQFDEQLSEMAYEHLQIMIGQNTVIPYNDEYDIEDMPVVRIYGLVSGTKKTMHSTFQGFENNVTQLNTIHIEDLNRIGTAVHLHNGNYYTVTLLAHLNPALDLP